MGLTMDNQRYHHAKPKLVRLKQWKGNEDEESGQCEQSSNSISDNLIYARQLLANVKEYLKSGVVLLDMEESDLDNITIRVAEQV